MHWDVQNDLTRDLSLLLQVWSNDANESVEHRALVNKEKERFSIPFFFNPGYDIEIKPLEELINEQNPSKYKPYKWGKFYVHRTNSNFKKQEEENLQIYHYISYLRERYFNKCMT